jgi:transposase
VSRRSSSRRGRPAQQVSVEIVRDLYGQGYSFRAISETIGLGYGTVRRAFHGLAPDGAQREPASTESGKRRKQSASA